MRSRLKINMRHFSFLRWLVFSILLALLIAMYIFALVFEDIKADLPHQFMQLPVWNAVVLLLYLGSAAAATTYAQATPTPFGGDDPAPSVAKLAMFLNTFVPGYTTLVCVVFWFALIFGFVENTWEHLSGPWLYFNMVLHVNTLAFVVFDSTVAHQALPMRNGVLNIMFGSVWVAASATYYSRTRRALYNMCWQEEPRKCAAFVIGCLYLLSTSYGFFARSTKVKKKIVANRFTEGPAIEFSSFPGKREIHVNMPPRTGSQGNPSEERGKLFEQACKDLLRMDTIRAVDEPGPTIKDVEGPGPMITEKSTEKPAIRFAPVCEEVDPTDSGDISLADSGDDDSDGSNTHSSGSEPDIDDTKPEQ